MLLKAGAKVDVQDNNGNTPLGRAVFDARGRTGMVKLLLKHGADRHHKNKHGVSPSELVKTFGDPVLASVMGS